MCELRLLFVKLVAIINNAEKQQRPSITASIEIIINDAATMIFVPSSLTITITIIIIIKLLFNAIRYHSIPFHSIRFDSNELNEFRDHYVRRCCKRCCYRDDNEKTLLLAKISRFSNVNNCLLNLAEIKKQ